MRDFVAKVEHGLQPGMMLSAEELRACIRAAAFFADHQAAGGDAEHLHRAIPKLDVLLQKSKVRETIEAEQRRRGR